MQKFQNLFSGPNQLTLFRIAAVPVIIVSARDQKQDAAAGYHVVGNDLYVEKPFEIDELVQAVYDVLE